MPRAALVPQATAPWFNFSLATVRVSRRPADNKRVSGGRGNKQHPISHVLTSAKRGAGPTKLSSSERKQLYSSIGSLVKMIWRALSRENRSWETTGKLRVRPENRVGSCHLESSPTPLFSSVCLEGLLAEVHAHTLEFPATKDARHMAAAESTIIISLNQRMHYWWERGYFALEPMGLPELSDRQPNITKIRLGLRRRVLISPGQALRDGSWIHKVCSRSRPRSAS
ncbi:hypothetical protein LX32DRAFT_229215 [Colletotrichum zoysiae]|uniref:Uncharacterized protein n=1 Tax=Colletotrichum zoysiae TaxID=1216348 RepID=A0AAD9H3K8_9PEZI|nr:hypothetical protein LX32DRAFT_229215 [Colletotrichum zoysiae]